MLSAIRKAVKVKFRSPQQQLWLVENKSKPFARWSYFRYSLHYHSRHKTHSKTVCTLNFINNSSLLVAVAQNKISKCTERKPLQHHTLGEVLYHAANFTKRREIKTHLSKKRKCKQIFPFFQNTERDRNFFLKSNTSTILERTGHVRCGLLSRQTRKLDWSGLGAQEGESNEFVSERNTPMSRGIAIASLVRVPIGLWTVCALNFSVGSLLLSILVYR